jgi:ABC-2 type transport system permease protein
MTCVISTATAAPAIVNGLLFPILFISGTFYPVQPTSILGRIASVFPVQPFEQAMFAVFDPRLIGSGIEIEPLLLMLGWGGVALVVAVKRFRWEPRST